MIDLTLKDRNNQKKTLSVFTSGILTPEIINEDSTGAKVFVLPANSIVTDVYAVVLTGTGDDTDRISVRIGTSSQPESQITTDLFIDPAGVQDCTVTKRYVPVASDIYVLPAATLGTTGEFRVVVEYTELDLANGNYTN